MTSKAASSAWVANSALLQGLKQLSLWSLTPTSWTQGSLLTRWGGVGSTWGEGSLLCKVLDSLALVWGVALCLVAPYVETPVIGGILGLGLGLWLLMILTRPLHVTPITLGVLSLWGLTTVSTLCSPALKTSLYGWSLSTAYLVGFVLCSRIAETRRDWLVVAYLVTVAIVGAEGIHQWRSGAVALATWTDQESALKDTTRIYSYLGNPNLLASYLLPAVPLGIIGAIVWKKWALRLLGGVIAALAIFCIVLTYSRGGWLALTVEILALVGLGLGVMPKRLRLFLLGGVLGSISLSILLVPSLQIRLASIFSGRGDSSNNFRITVWDTVLRMIQDHFWLGIGPGNKTFEVIYPYYQRAGYNALGAYSVPLETWVELGFIGLVAFLWLLLIISAQGIRLWFTELPERAWWAGACLIFIIGILVQGLFDTVWYRPQIQTLWWLGVAMLNSLLVRKPAIKKYPPR
jgi:putative inorganic carbon (hco3(-)) transporter